MTESTPAVDPLKDGYRYNGEVKSASDEISDAEIVRTLPRPATTRPTIIDLADGPCEMCAAHKAGRCDRCGLDGNSLPNGLMGSTLTDATRHVGGSGFLSVKPSHFHLTPVLGISGREAHWDELCIECYRKDYTAVYGTEPPV